MGKNGLSADEFIMHLLYVLKSCVVECWLCQRSHARWYCSLLWL